MPASTTDMMQPLPAAATAATAADIVSYVIESYWASSIDNVFAMCLKGTKLTFYFVQYCPPLFEIKFNCQIEFKLEIWKK